MKWILENWILIAVAICVAAAAINVIVCFLKQPHVKQIQNIKEWLKWAVVQAEKELGGGTGQLKLRMVYDLAVQKFPWIINCITFEQFSTWVDEALEWMKAQLSSNTAVQSIVEGSKE